MNAFNLRIYEFTDIDDRNLQEEATCVTDEFPCPGKTMMQKVFIQRKLTHKICAASDNTTRLTISRELDIASILIIYLFIYSGQISLFIYMLKSIGRYNIWPFHWKNYLHIQIMMKPTNMLFIISDQKDQGQT